MRVFLRQDLAGRIEPAVLHPDLDSGIGCQARMGLRNVRSIHYCENCLTVFNAIHGNSGIVRKNDNHL